VRQDSLAGGFWGHSLLKDLLRHLVHRGFEARYLAWPELRVRRVLDPLRRDGLVQSAVNTTIATLRLSGLFPSPLAALETYGKFGLRKALDCVNLRKSLDCPEIESGIARRARRFLPPVARTHGDDSGVEVRERRLPCRDFNFVMIDNGFGNYGRGYCEQFHLFPGLYDYLASLAVIVMHVLLVHRIAQNDPAHVQRRRAFFGTSSNAETMTPPLALVVEAYPKRLPHARHIQQALVVPNPVNRSRPNEDVYFLVLSVRSSQEGPS